MNPNQRRKRRLTSVYGPQMLRPVREAELLARLAREDAQAKAIADFTLGWVLPVLCGASLLACVLLGGFGGR